MRWESWARVSNLIGDHRKNMQTEVADRLSSADLGNQLRLNPCDNKIQINHNSLQEFHGSL